MAGGLSDRLGKDLIPVLPSLVIRMLLAALDGSRNYLTKQFEIFDLQAARGSGRNPETQPRPFGRLCRIEWNRVLVGGEVNQGKAVLNLLAFQATCRKIEQYHMGVGAATNQFYATLRQHRLGGDDLGVQAALYARENGGLELFCPACITRQN